MKPIQNHVLISDLLQAIQLPFALAVCKCSAHTNQSDPISQGNAKDNAVDKAAACSSSAAAASHIFIRFSHYDGPELDVLFHATIGYAPGKARLEAKQLQS